MRGLSYLVIPFLALMAACLLPVTASAKAISLLEAPQDNAKVVGSIDLSAGIIPIYTPKDGLWVKVADPRNGNTGWVKSSELKDSQGNVLSVMQSVKEGANGSKTQSTEMSYGKPLTPDQKAAVQQQLLQQQAQSMQLIQKSLDDAKKLYKQQVDIMQNLGFPVVPGMGTAPAAPEKKSAP